MAHAQEAWISAQTGYIVEYRLAASCSVEASGDQRRRSRHPGEHHGRSNPHLAPSPDARPGSGRALAEEVCSIAKGERVFATARKPEELSDLVASRRMRRALKLDVTVLTDIKAAVAEVDSRRAASTSSSTMPAMAISRRSRRATRMAIAPSSRRTCSV